MKASFLKKWILDFIKSEYELGKIPKHANYRHRERTDDFIEITLEWADEHKNTFKIVYHGKSYGKEKISKNIEKANDSIFELENYHTLEIHRYENRIKRGYSTQKISDYDVKKIVEELVSSGSIKEL